MAEIEHPRLTVMFTDIKGYSRMMSEDEATALRVLEEHNAIMESVISAHGGRVFKRLGDAYMVIFEQVDAAVKCGMHSLTRMAARNRQQKPPVEIRIGIHEGPMLERDGDFFGETVNIASRLEQMGTPMTITVTERVLAEVATRIKAEVRFVGAELLKNLRYPVSVYEITPAEVWKLFLKSDGTVAEGDSPTGLDEMSNPREVWDRVGERTREGDLQNATQLAEAALSRFGGYYSDYAHLAALFLIARMESEAQSALHMGQLLGQKAETDEQLRWLERMVKSSLPGSQEQAESLKEAQAYAINHPDELPMQVLVENLKCRLTGYVGGLANLVQQHPDSALVLRGYAEALKDQHRETDAYAMLEQAIAVAPRVADHQLRRLRWLVEEGDLDTILVETGKLAQRFPRDAHVYEWTGMVRLLNLDPHGAQWIFEQGQESALMRRSESVRGLVISLMQQGRFEKGLELARREMRSAIRQNRRRAAREFLDCLTMGSSLQRWEGVLESLEEYRRYDPDWPAVQRATVVAKHQRRMIPWDRVMSQLDECSRKDDRFDDMGRGVVNRLALLGVVPDADRWLELHSDSWSEAMIERILESGDVQSAAMELRGAILFRTLSEGHRPLISLLTGLANRLDPRLASWLSLAGLTEVRLAEASVGAKTIPETARGWLEQACKFWRGVEWNVWEIQEAEAILSQSSGRSEASVVRSEPTN